MDWDLDLTDIIVALFSALGVAANALFTYFRTNKQSKQRQQKESEERRFEAILNYLTSANHFLENLSYSSYTSFSKSAATILMYLPNEYKDKTKALNKQIKFIKDHPNNKNGAFYSSQYEVNKAKAMLDDLTDVLGNLIPKPPTVRVKNLTKSSTKEH